MQILQMRRDVIRCARLSSVLLALYTNCKTDDLFYQSLSQKIECNPRSKDSNDNKYLKGFRIVNKPSKNEKSAIEVKNINQI